MGKQKISGFAIISLILSIISFLLTPFIFGIISLGSEFFLLGFVIIILGPVFGVFALFDIKKNNKRGISSVIVGFWINGLNFLLILIAFSLENMIANFDS